MQASSRRLAYSLHMYLDEHYIIDIDRVTPCPLTKQRCHPLLAPAC